MTKQHFILAVDGGGTKTTAWVADQSGKVVGKATTGPMSLAATSQKHATEHFLDAVKQASEGLNILTFSNVVIGLAGVDTKEELQLAIELFSSELKQLYGVTHFELVNDTIIALASGTQAKNAICLISGTGSNCFGQNESGLRVKAGGMDYLLSDQGSGFDIGQQVLRAAVKSYDGRSKKSVIEKLVCAHFEISSIEQLKNKVYHPILNKTKIGELAHICFEAKDEHDATANEIIRAAIEDLMEMVLTVLRRLDLTNITTDVVLVGGIATDPFIHSQLELRVQANYPKVRFVIPQNPPVYGALQLALQAMD